MEPQCGRPDAGAGYPGEMPLFTLGLADVGARVIGVGDQPVRRLARRRPPRARRLRADPVVGGRGRRPRRRCSTSLRGPQRRPRRVAVGADDAAGGPPPRGHRRARADRGADRAVPRQGAHEGGARGRRHPHPAVRTQHDRRRVPGGRRADRLPAHHQAHRRRRLARHLPHRGRHRCLEDALGRLGHVPEVSVEEFIDGEEFTYDTVCAAGRIAFDNICWYRPRPLVGKQVERTTQQVIALRDLDAPDLAGGRAMGEAVIAAMGFTSGFTHMEWYRKWDGEVVFGEIGARAPGGSPDRPHELHLRHRPVPGVGRGRVPRHVQPADRAPVQRRR